MGEAIQSLQLLDPNLSSGRSLQSVRSIKSLIKKDINSADTESGLLCNALSLDVCRVGPTGNMSS